MKRIEFDPVTDDLLEQMVKTIVEVADPTRIILFGSQASGRASEDSDVDLLIIEEEPFDNGRNKFEELVKIRQALRKYFLPKDLLVYSEAEVEHWRDSTNHILARCLREGRQLYARHPSGA